MDVRWLTAFIDRPADTFDRSTAFWQRLTGSALSPSRGRSDQFATLLPPDGDAYLRVQRVEVGPGGSHLDVHVDDVDSAAAAAAAAGAVATDSERGVATMHSPAGLPFCIVRHDGQRARPSPHPLAAGGPKMLVDQLCIDIPADRHDEECRFWEEATGWPYVRSEGRPEFGWVETPASMPLRLLLQRRGDSDGPARCHLDIASEDRGATANALEGFGANAVASFERWIVMADPSGLEFCVTARDPHTGIHPT